MKLYLNFLILIIDNSDYYSFELKLLKYIYVIDN